MESLRRELRKMRAQVSGDEYILLEDGTKFYYDRTTMAMERFKHTAEEIRADYKGRPRPSEPPDILKAVVRAKNRRAALRQIYPEWETSRPFTGYDLHALAETGELVRVPFAHGVAMVEEDENEGLVVESQKNEVCY